MEMLAANKMNLRRIFAAGWQEGESDAGGKGQWRQQTETGGWRGLEASFPHGGGGKQGEGNVQRAAAGKTRGSAGRLTCAIVNTPLCVCVCVSAQTRRKRHQLGAERVSWAPTRFVPVRPRAFKITVSSASRGAKQGC